jgi:lipid A disaccharide synthetase
MIDELNLSSDKPIVALVPGLRETEVKVYLPTLFKAVNRINVEERAVQTVVAVPQSINQGCCDKLIEKWDVE